MLDFEKVLDILGGLTLLKFFPSDSSTRLELAKLVGRMASSEEQVEWLVQRTLAVCNEWPGPLVLRQIFCGKFKPKDGIEAGSTAMFPDGPPSERKINAPEFPALPPGHLVSADPHLDRLVREIAAEKDLNAVKGRVHEPFTAADMEELKRRRREWLQQENAKHPLENPITEADVKAAEDEYYTKKMQGKPN